MSAQVLFNLFNSLRKPRIFALFPNMFYTFIET